MYRGNRANAKLLEASYYHGLAKLDLDPPDAVAAVESLKRAAPLKQEDPGYWFFLGTACQHARQFRQAARAFEEAARLYGRHQKTRGFCLTAHKRAGACAHLAGEDKAAARAFANAYKLDPSDESTPNSTNSVSYGSLSRPPQRGDFCGIAN